MRALLSLNKHCPVYLDLRVCNTWALTGGNTQFGASSEATKGIETREIHGDLMV